MKKATLEKIFEYASMPVHGTLSRKLRKDIQCQVNDGKIYDGATFFLGKSLSALRKKTAGKRSTLIMTGKVSYPSVPLQTAPNK